MAHRYALSSAARSQKRSTRNLRWYHNSRFSFGSSFLAYANYAAPTIPTLRLSHHGSIIWQQDRHRSTVVDNDDYDYGYDDYDRFDEPKIENLSKKELRACLRGLGVSRNGNNNKLRTVLQQKLAAINMTLGELKEFVSEKEDYDISDDDYTTGSNEFLEGEDETRIQNMSHEELKACLMVLRVFATTINSDQLRTLLRNKLAEHNMLLSEVIEIVSDKDYGFSNNDHTAGSNDYSIDEENGEKIEDLAEGEVKISTSQYPPSTLSNMMEQAFSQRSQSQQQHDISGTNNSIYEKDEERRNEVPEGEGKSEELDFNSHTIPMLKDELRARGLRVGGKKAELLERLESHIHAGKGKRLKEEIGKCFQLEIGTVLKELAGRGISTLSFTDKSEIVLALAEARVADPFWKPVQMEDEADDHTLAHETTIHHQVDLSTVETPTMCAFDKANNYQLSLMDSLQDRQHDALLSPALAIPDEVDALLDLLPPHLKGSPWLEGDRRSDLIEIVLDLGRRPTCWVGGKREFLFPSGGANGDVKATSDHSDVSDDNQTADAEAFNTPEDSLVVSNTNTAQHDTPTTILGEQSSSYVVSRDDLDHVLGDLRFGEDNRAGVERCLHRISGVRNRDGELIGATLRVGRYVPGNAVLIADMLHRTNSSILFVGPPGSAKTSILRDAARILSEEHSVVIVDTSCEIGGAGDIPHDCIGQSRRMQVKNIQSQAKVMVECVQNHTPSVIVIDEIGRGEEVQAALTCKERGVRIMASAHGSLPGLVRNAELCELVGGVDVVTIGDRSAQKQAQKGGSGSKLKAERKGPPVFDVVVELQRGHLHEWHVVLHTSTAVDNILGYGKYHAQIRRRHPEGKEAGIEIQNVVSLANREEILEEQQQSVRSLSAMTKSAQEIFDPDKFDWEPYLRPDTKHLIQCPVCKKKLKSNKGMMNHASSTRCKKQLPPEVFMHFTLNR